MVIPVRQSGFCPCVPGRVKVCVSLNAERIRPDSEAMQVLPA